MVTVRKMIQEDRTYYYLEHPVKINGKPRMRSKFIGKTVPDNLEEMMKQFLLEIENNRWSPIFDEIQARIDPFNREKDNNVHSNSERQFVIKFIADSMKISGSSITPLELGRMIEDGRKPANRPIKEVKEALAYYNVFQELLSDESEITQEILIDWHWRIFRETVPLSAGELRTVDGDSSTGEWPFNNYPELEQKLNALFEWYNKVKSEINPVILAGLFHVLLWSLNIFEVGNGRISRLATNIILFQNGFPMLDIEYNERKRYQNALARSMEKKNEYEFLKWFCLKYSRKFVGNL